MYSGDSLVLKFTAYEADKVTRLNLAAVDLIWQISKNVKSQPLLAKSTGNGIVVTDPTNGLFEVYVSHTETKLWLGDYYHEVKIVSGGLVSTIYSGDITFERSLPLPGSTAQITQIRGDSWIRAWVLKYSDGSIIDLTDASALLHLRDAEGQLVASAGTVAGTMTITPESGRVDMIMPAADMELPLGAYSFDLQVTFASGIVKTYEQGTVTVVQDQTYA